MEDPFVTQSVKDSFGLIWPRHVQNLTRLLISCREAFDGDLDFGATRYGRGNGFGSFRYGNAGGCDTERLCSEWG